MSDPICSCQAHSLFPAVKFIERNRVFDVNAKAHHGDGTAVLVVARIGHVLIIDGERNPAPDMRRVIGLEDLFEAVVQSAIAQNEAQPAQRQVAPVIAREPVRDESGAYFVLRTAPRLPRKSLPISAVRSISV